MSHFVVFTSLIHHPESSAGKRELEDKLQPYHEYETTDYIDEYVKHVDITEKVRNGYEAGKTTVFVKDGEIFDKYLDQFYRKPTSGEVSQKLIGTYGTIGDTHYVTKDWGDGEHKPRIHYRPEGYEEVEVPTSELETIEEYAEAHCGITIVIEDGEELPLSSCLVRKNGEIIKVYQFTNPNSKWDYWLVGGRYSNWLQKFGIEGCWAKKSDFNFTDLVEKNRKRLTAEWKKVREHVDVETFVSWSNEMKLEEYRAQPQLQAFRKFTWYGSENPEDEVLVASIEAYKAPLEEFVEAHKYMGIAPFALLHDQWLERGDMGWFATVGNEKENWAQLFVEAWDKIPDDQWIVVVDCHV